MRAASLAWAARVVGVSTVASALRAGPLAATAPRSPRTRALAPRTLAAEATDGVTGTKFAEDDETKNPQRRPGHQVTGMREVDPETAARQERIRAHQEGCARLPWAEEIRTMAAQQKGFGVLSTVGTKEGIEGFPVGSVVGFAVDERGRPIFCFSSMSAHTKNLVGDARASLTVTEPSFQGAADARCVRRGSVLEAFQLGLSMPRSARAQVLTGRVTRVTDAAVADELRAAYIASHPGAFWANFGDFHLYRMEDLLDVAFVGGFARAGGVTPEEYMAAEVDPVAGFLGPVAAHMNADHEDALRSYVTELVGAAEVASAEMKRLDRFGFDVRIVDAATKSTGVLRVPFLDPVTDRKGIKDAIVQLSKEVAARQAAADEEG